MVKGNHRLLSELAPSSAGAPFSPRIPSSSWQTAGHGSVLSGSQLLTVFWEPVLLTSSPVAAQLAGGIVANHKSAQETGTEAQHLYLGDLLKPEVPGRGNMGRVGGPGREQSWPQEAKTFAVGSLAFRRDEACRA